MMLQIVLSCERIVTLAVCKRFIVEFSQILKKNVNENILFYVFGCVKTQEHTPQTFARPTLYFCNCYSRDCDLTSFHLNKLQ